MTELPPPPKPREVEGKKDLNAVYQLIVELYDAGEYGKALPLADRYVASIKDRVGGNHVAYAAAISLLARIYHGQGRFTKAEALVKRALVIHEQKLGREHADVASDLDALAQLYQEQGRLDEAEPLFKRALAVNEKAVGSDHPNVGRTLNNLAWLYQAQGRYAEAEPHVKRALAIVEKHFGPKYADYGRVLDTLAKLSEGQGLLPEAEQHYQRALTILENSLGPEHASVAITRENLGGLYKSQGKLEEAEPLLKSALAIKQKAFGSEHASVAHSFAQLGDLYRLQGRPDEAEPLFLRALAIRKAAIREIPVFYATDRKQEKNTKTISFGGERSQTLSFGQATVMVPKPEGVPGRAPLPTINSDQPPKTKVSDFETTEVTRLAIRHIGTVDDDRQIVEEVQRHVDSARIFRNQIFVFVHGYNVSFENALRRTAQIAYDLNFDGAAFLFSWPSRGRLWSYWYDRESAGLAVNHLKEFLEKIVAETKATKVHLIAHSMGNVVLLDALEKIKFSSRDLSRWAFAEIVLHAPDVDKDRFRQLMKSIKGVGRSVTLYASARDWALGISGWVWGLVGRAGAIPSVVAGVETIDVTAAGSSLLGLDHDLYATNPTIFNDMRRLLELGEHPPDKRSPVFQPTATENGTYWLYRQEDAEAKRLAEKAEAERKAAWIAEAKRRADEAEANRKAEEAEAKRRAEDAEAKRLVEKAEAERKAEREAEAKRRAEGKTPQKSIVERVRRKLRSEGYVKIEFTRSTPPFRVKACDGEWRLRIDVDNYGTVANRTLIGFCFEDGSKGPVAASSPSVVSSIKRASRRDEDRTHMGSPQRGRVPLPHIPIPLP